MIIKSVVALLAAAAAALVTAAPAGAATARVLNVPPAQTVTNTIRLPAQGGAPDGSVTTTVTYTDTTVNATATTGNTIALVNGYLWN